MATTVYNTLCLRGPRESVDACVRELTEHFWSPDSRSVTDSPCGSRDIRLRFYSRSRPAIDTLVNLALTYTDCAFEGTWDVECVAWKGGRYAFPVGDDRTLLVLHRTCEDLQTALTRAQETFARLDGSRRLAAMVQEDTDEEYAEKQRAFDAATQDTVSTGWDPASDGTRVDATDWMSDPALEGLCDLPR